jgi:hypothetical protein
MSMFFPQRNRNLVAGVLKARKMLGKIVLRFSDYSLKRELLTRRARRERRECGV